MVSWNKVCKRWVIFLLFLISTPTALYAQTQPYGEDPDAVVLPPKVERTILDLKGEIVDLKAGDSALLNQMDGIKVVDMGLEYRIEMAADLLFDFDQSKLRPSAESALIKIAEFIEIRKSPELRIEGHTDAKGKRDYNQKLSEARATTVQEWLTSHLKNSIPMQTVGYADTKPVAPNTFPDGKDNPEGRQKNRRVEIYITKSAEEKKE
ncbi:MAG: OmpA family protein [Alphaproteobacteria bacterium]|nr:OmpA family protein [Alphaproteobacteria bacterium]